MNGKCITHIGLGLILLTALMLALPAGSWGAPSSAGTLDIRVADVADDAEENGGTVTLNENDLDLGQKDAVGIRFQNVTIPQGSEITRAYIQFTADVVSAGATSLTFYTEKQNHAPAFMAMATNITSRDISGATVDWINVPVWGSASETGVVHQSPDLSEIVEAVVKRAGWVEGNAIVFVVKGSGHRVATGYQYDAGKAPLLHVEYAAGAIDVPILDSDDDAQEAVDGVVDKAGHPLEFDNSHTVGLRFQNVNVPPGAEITRAYISLAADAVHTEATSMSIYVQAHDDADAFSNGNHDISKRILSADYIRWTGVAPWITVNNYYQTPDLSPLVQQIVGRSGWAANNAMVFVLVTSHGLRQAISYNGNPDYRAVLHIEYAQDNLPIISTNKPNLGASCRYGQDAARETFTITNTGVGTLNFSLSDDADWITLAPISGSLSAGQSATITVTYDTDGKNVGTYSGRITITAAGAVNTPAELFVSLTVLEQQVAPVCSNIPVYAQELASPALMILLDTTDSMKSLVPVDVYPVYMTGPDISAIVQEIVDRSDWNSSQAMFFLLEHAAGSGQRAMWNWFQSAAMPPALRIVYNAGGGDQTITLQTAGEWGDGMEVVSTGAVDTRNIMLLGNNNSGQETLVGLRFDDVAIPRNATIVDAYFEFIAAEVDSDALTLTIWGEDTADAPAIPRPQFGNAYNLSNRLGHKTSAAVSWVVAPWDAITWKSRGVIAQEVIKEIIQDSSIAWGLGSWDSRKNAADKYTVIHQSCEAGNTAAIEAALDALSFGGNTPYSKSIEASTDYFKGMRSDEDGDIFVDVECQPKFLINITDGAGDASLGSTTDSVAAAVRSLADTSSGPGVTPVAVGFDMEQYVAELPDWLDQILRFADEANAAGDADPNDDIYAIHEEDGGVAQPFYANSKMELLDALRAVTDNVKGAIYHGAAPAPTTSTDLGDTVIVAQYDAATWTGDVKRVQKDASGQWVSPVWSANAEMPSPRNLFTIDPATPGSVVPYVDGTLTGDNFDCLDPANPYAVPIGDIINSRPVVVDHPPFWYPFDGYGTFGLNLARDPMIYVGANDGALHAIQLTDGVERWAFFPESLHAKLEAADSDELFDRCADGYCHQYYVDGSPVVADVFAKFGALDKDWHTMLVVGLREGGESYFALDVTHGQEFDAADADKRTKFLWEFTDAELGQTWGDASIERVAIKDQDQKNDDPFNESPSEWAVFFSSGYTTDMTGKEAYVYGIEADDAAPLWKDEGGVDTNRIKLVSGGSTLVGYEDHTGPSFQVGETLMQVNGPAASGTIVAVNETSTTEGTLTLDAVTGSFEAGKDIEGVDSTAEAQVVSVTAGSGGLTANALSPVLAADLLAPTRPVDPWLSYYADYLYVGDLYGNLYRISDIGKGMTPQVAKLFTFNNAANDDNPIRGKASYGYDFVLEDIWVYFGTGIYEQQLHKGNNEQQYFFGLKDGVLPAATYQLGDLVNLMAKFDTETIGSETHMFRYIEGDNAAALPWKMQLFASQPVGWGWTGTLPTGSERMFTQPLVVGEVVFFTTFIPDGDVCGGSGETWLFALNFNTGTMAREAVFDINGDGVFDDKDKIDTDGDGVKDIFPVGIRIGRGQGSQPVLHKDTLFVTVSGEGDKFFAVKVNVPKSRVRIRSWWQN